MDKNILQKGKTVGGRIGPRLGGTGPFCIDLRFNTRTHCHSEMLCITKLTRYRFTLFYVVLKGRGRGMMGTTLCGLTALALKSLEIFKFIISNKFTDYTCTFRNLET